MADPRQLARLVREVRNAASPLKRMKVVARAWRTLQRLSPTERAALASPAAYVHEERWLPPVLTVHGTDDERVPFEQALVLDQVLTASGNDHLLCPVRGAGHGFDLHVGGRDLRPVVRAFLAKVFP